MLGGAFAGFLGSYSFQIYLNGKEIQNQKFQQEILSLYDLQQLSLIDNTITDEDKLSTFLLKRYNSEGLPFQIVQLQDSG